MLLAILRWFDRFYHSQPINQPVQQTDHQSPRLRQDPLQQEPPLALPPERSQRFHHATFAKDRALIAWHNRPSASIRHNPDRDARNAPYGQSTALFQRCQHGAQQYQPRHNLKPAKFRARCRHPPESKLGNQALLPRQYIDPWRPDQMAHVRHPNIKSLIQTAPKSQS